MARLKTQAERVRQRRIALVRDELTKAMEGIGGALSGLLPGAPKIKVEPVEEEPKEALDQALAEAQKAAAETEQEAMRSLPAAPSNATSSSSATASAPHWSSIPGATATPTATRATGSRSSP